MRLMVAAARRAQTTRLPVGRQNVEDCDYRRIYNSAIGVPMVKALTN
jgi:hypothetical protein